MITLIKKSARIGVAASAAALSSVLCLVPGLTGGLPTAAARPAPPDRTSAVEARRVDSVPTPKLKWYPCNDYPGAQCATVKLPLDYDEPKATRSSWRC